jgi:hypothetical protein
VETVWRFLEFFIPATPSPGLLTLGTTGDLFCVIVVFLFGKIFFILFGKKKKKILCVGFKLSVLHLGEECIIFF